MHKFIPSAGLDHTKCGVPGCGYNEIDHDDNQPCEACSNVGVREPINNMLLCRECLEKEKVTLALEVPERLVTNEVKDLINGVFTSQSAQIRAAEMARLSDSSILTRKDLYNAKVPSIQELKDVIAKDITIKNKAYELASILVERFRHNQDVIFNHQEIVMVAANENKALQQEMNDLASKLRQEEREKLKIADITYKPGQVKTPKISKGGKNKLDKNEVRQIAAVINMPEFIVQTFCIANNVSPIVAAEMLTKLKNKTTAQMTKKEN